MNNYPPEVRELLLAKSSPDLRASVVSAMADAFAAAIRSGQTILLASDSDGTMTPFNDVPLDSRVDPKVAAVFRAYASIAEEWVITGGDVARTALVLGESGLYINGLCNYGGETLRWVEGKAQLSFHPRAGEIAPLLEDVVNELDRLIAPHLNLADGQHAVVDTREEAIALGRVFAERKGIVVAFHPKGQDKSPAIENLVETYVPVAVSNAQARWAAERLQRATQGLQVDLLEEAIDKVHTSPGNSGNYEVAWDLGISKYTAMNRLVSDHQPKAVAFSGDDTGDIPAVQKLTEMRAEGTITFFICVANAPEPEKGRVGARRELLEMCDLAVLSPRDLGHFYADVLLLAAERNADLELLTTAAGLLPERDITRIAER